MTRPPDSASAETDIAAPPAEVWALVSDLPRMGRFSPENTGGRWLPGTTGPAVGSRFLGTNRNGWRRWITVATVVESERERRFAFKVAVPFMRVSRWTFELQPSGTGTRLRQSWSIGESRTLRLLGPAVTGRRRRGDWTPYSMSTTLARMKAEAERTQVQ